MNSYANNANTAYIERMSTLYYNEGLYDYDLWEVYKYDFGHWSVHDFSNVPTRVLDKFRFQLRNQGLYTPYNYQPADSLIFALKYGLYWNKERLLELLDYNVDSPRVRHLFPQYFTGLRRTAPIHPYSTTPSHSTSYNAPKRPTPETSVARTTSTFDIKRPTPIFVLEAPVSTVIDISVTPTTPIHEAKTGEPPSFVIKASKTPVREAETPASSLFVPQRQIARYLIRKRQISPPPIRTYANAIFVSSPLRQHPP